MLDNGQVVKSGKARSLEPAGEGLVVSSAVPSDGSTQPGAAGSAAVPADQVAAYPAPDQDALDAIDPKRQQGDWSVYSYYFKEQGGLKPACSSVS